MDLITMLQELVKENSNIYGLHFIEDDELDIGATIHFTWILLKNKDLASEYENRIKQILNFVSMSFTNKIYTKHAYSWFLSSILSIYKYKFDEAK